MSGFRALVVELAQPALVVADPVVEIAQQSFGKRIGTQTLTQREQIMLDWHINPGTRHRR